MESFFLYNFAQQTGGQLVSRAEPRGGRSPSAHLPSTSTAAWFHMYNYIPHPSNYRHASGIVALRIEEGAAGYGIYWMIIELLRDAPSFKFSGNPRAIAFAINEANIELVSRVIGNYGLFDFDDDGLLLSPWLLDAMGAYADRKTKLQEAGRRGAAKRWAAAHGTDGQAIANPSLEDGQAIAHNLTLPNITEQDITQPNGEAMKDWREVLSVNSPRVTAEYFEMIFKTQTEGHAPGFIAQCCMHYGMTEAVCDFICNASDNGNMSNPIYKKFCALVKRIQQDKWKPDHPANFFLSKLFDK